MKLTRIMHALPQAVLGAGLCLLLPATFGLGPDH